MLQSLVTQASTIQLKSVNPTRSERHLVCVIYRLITLTITKKSYQMVFNYIIILTFVSSLDTVSMVY